MFGFNWVDAVVVILLGLAVWEGVRIGLLSQLFVIISFFAVLFLSGWAYPHVVRFSDPLLRTVVNAILVLLTAIYAAVRSFDLAQHIHWTIRLGEKDRHRLKQAEMVLGCVPGLAAGLTLVWLLGVMVGRLPLVGFSNSVNDARIVRSLVAVLPPVPAVFAEFDAQIDPNTQPYVPVVVPPQPKFNYVAEAVGSAAASAESSMVRITSFSCGGIVSGSGFAVGPGLVATNAHVIAGSQRPVIKYNGASYESVPVYFDATLDVAMLRVPGLHAPVLKLAPANITLDTTVAVLGYPGGNYTVQPGIIRDTLAVAGASIYDRGTFGRGIYVVQTHVEYGNSGGPAVMPDGEVAGIIYSRSPDVSDVAYALTSVHLTTALQKAAKSHAKVGTGACMVD